MCGKSACAWHLELDTRASSRWRQQMAFVLKLLGVPGSRDIVHSKAVGLSDYPVRQSKSIMSTTGELRCSSSHFDFEVEACHVL